MSQEEGYPMSEDQSTPQTPGSVVEMPWVLISNQIQLLSTQVDILPGLKSGASPSLTSLRPRAPGPIGRRSRCIPPLKRGVLANGLL